MRRGDPWRALVEFAAIGAPLMAWGAVLAGWRVLRGRPATDTGSRP